MRNLGKILIINNQIEEIINKAKALENNYADLISNVHSSYCESALSLTHYLAFRSFDIQ